MHVKKNTFVLLASIFLFGNAFAQCNLYELTLSEKVGQSTNIIEGKVIDQSCFWNEEHTLIFTSNSIEVFKVFKGNASSSQIEIITLGGIVDDEMQTMVPNLELAIDDIGIFTLIPSKVYNPSSSISTWNVFEAYGSLQGFFKYDLIETSATVPFQKYNNIGEDLYKQLENLLKTSYQEINAFDVNHRESLAKAGGSITSFTPTTITAGTNSILTINGGGFGTSRGSSKVQFKNADDGGGSYFQVPSNSQYISWSDTEIKVIVPDQAGTGTIRVVTSSNITSSSTLTIRFAEMNTSGSTPYLTDHVDVNSTGGLTWQMYTSFNNNSAAKASFLRALNTWRCSTNINWELGATTNVNSIGRDGTSVIRFDSGNELSAGVLGTCYTYWSGCGTSVWYVKELDMVIDDGANWEYGPTSPTGSEYDFESVMLHELGHGHQLGHVIDNSDVMNYAVTNATMRRGLNSNNLAAGNDLMSRSVVANTCSLGPMVALTGQCAIGGTVADFSASAVSGCPGLSVSFTDLSTESPNSWAWDVNNDGTVDYTSKNPVHVYSSSGTYAVKLKVSNAFGTDSIIKTNFITVSTSPAGAFTYTVSGATVNFTNTSTDATSYLWDFGNGSGSNLENPSNTYTNAGTYTVTLTATNSCGDNSVSEEITIGVNGAINKPTPAFSANVTSGCTALSVSFIDSSTESPTNWAWDVDNDGQMDYTVQNPSHVYAASGTYSVKLIVTNGIGTDSILKTNFIVVDSIPVSGFGSSVSDSTVSFINSSSNAVSYSWNFGDGNNSTQENPVHVYSGDGTYTATLTATNSCGSNIFSEAVTILPPLVVAKPIASFSGNNTSGCAPLLVNFSDLSSASPSSWEWDIDNDGTVDYSTQNPTHTFNVAGNYTVKLKVANAGGADSSIINGYITVLPSPTVAAISGQTVCSGFSISENNLISSPPGATFIWANSNTAIGLAAGGTGNVPGFKTSTAVGTGLSGSITVSPTLNGCSGTASTYSITVLPFEDPGFSYTKTTFCTNDVNPIPTIESSGGTFTASAGLVMDSNTGVINIFASGEGSFNITYTTDGLCPESSNVDIIISDNPNATFTYPSPVCINAVTAILPVLSSGASAGVFSAEAGLNFVSTATGEINLAASLAGDYKVWNTINGAGACAGTIDSSSIRINPLPVAAFSNFVSFDTAIFTNSSLSAESYSWDFGDLASSTQMNDTHIYLAEGTYTVKLNSSNSCGTDSTSQEITTLLATGISESETTSFMHVFPSPSSGIVTINFPENKNPSRLSVMDYTGAIVADVKNLQGNESSILNLSHLKDGLYCIIVNLEGQMILRNIVISK